MHRLPSKLVSDNSNIKIKKKECKMFYWHFNKKNTGNDEEMRRKICFKLLGLLAMLQRSDCRQQLKFSQP